MSQRRTNSNRTVRKWTPEEEDILIDEIGKNPTCMKACFLAASPEIGRSASAIANHWYKSMAGRQDVCAKLTIGRHACVKNKVRLKHDQQPKSILRSIYDHLLRMIFNNDGR